MDAGRAACRFPARLRLVFAQDPAAVMVAGQDGVSRWPIELDEQRQQVAVGPPQRWKRSSHLIACQSAQ